jgi:ribonuclease P protein component
LTFPAFSINEAAEFSRQFRAIWLLIQQPLSFWKWRVQTILENDREADLSTQQARAQAPSWFSRPHGHQWRCQGDRGPPGARSQASFGLISSGPVGLPVETDSMERLKKRRDFLRVQKGRRVHTGLFSVQVLQQETETVSRVGFTVSKRVSLSAVKRNRIRRRLKEAMRTQDHGVSARGTDFVIVAKIEALTAPFTRITSELTRALRKSVLLNPDDPSAPQPRAP